MVVKDQVFYHANKYLDWKVGDEMFVGGEPTPQYMALMSRDAIYNDSAGNAYPLTLIANAYEEYKETGKLPEYLPQHLDLKKGPIFSSSVKAMNDYCLITREMIFEEIRKESFPEKPSRTKSFHLIPDDKEAVQFWLPRVASPEHKLYKLKVYGKVHKANIDLLSNDSVSPMMMKFTAFHYWLGAPTEDHSNEWMFQGSVEVLNVQDIK